MPSPPLLTQLQSVKLTPSCLESLIHSFLKPFQHNLKQTNPIKVPEAHTMSSPILCHGVFTVRFIFLDTFFSTFSPENGNVRYEKGKPKVIQRSKIHF